MTIKEQLRYYGKLVRSGNATDADKAFLARAQRAFDYLGLRTQRNAKPISGWWDLPVAKAMWEGDARDINA